jgi:starch synthase (maltosyl-transferring)
MEQARIVIEGVTPQVDAGRFAVKAVVGDALEVAADIWRDGHDKLRAEVLYRPVAPDEWQAQVGPVPADAKREGWQWVEMTTAYETNDRWTATIPLDTMGLYRFTVRAWTDTFASWRDGFEKKLRAGQDVSLELREGEALVELTRSHASASSGAALERLLGAIRATAFVDRRCEMMLADELLVMMQKLDPKLDAQLYEFECPVWVDREKARFGAWYEIFVRSQGTVPGRSATFHEAEARLPAIAAMGFDVLYLTPVHPIGRTFRKGKNNSLVCGPDDPGSPWAVGNEDGGHTAIHPDLGTIADFDHFVAEARRLGLEIALDFAVQCSPDHPWVKEHPAWFKHRPDGSIQYAENPPKKYQDIYPIDFETTDREGLYRELLAVARFWIDHGVTILRVDNPHTKPSSFWEWFIAEVHRRRPDVIFLAEAFTRPKRLARLAKVGFTQSYSYFTWRNTREELEEYAKELFVGDHSRYLRPNFFANTPDILHEYLQKGGRPAFIVRLILAATLSPTYGIYSGFELCENTPLHEGSEEYRDSEKYEIKVRNWRAPGHILTHVARVNEARREHRALRYASTLRLLESSDPNILAFAKTTPDKRDPVVVVVNLDPKTVHEGTVRVPGDLYGGSDSDWYRITDLLTGISYTWRGERNYVRLDPDVMPAHLFAIEQR